MQVCRPDRRVPRWRCFNLVIEMLFNASARSAFSRFDPVRMFQSRNRDAFQCKLASVRLHFSMSAPFQSRNRDAFQCKLPAATGDMYSFSVFQSRNRDAFQCKPDTGTTLDFGGLQVSIS